MGMTPHDWENLTHRITKMTIELSKIRHREALLPERQLVVEFRLALKALQEQCGSLRAWAETPEEFEERARGIHDHVSHSRE